MTVAAKRSARKRLLEFFAFDPGEVQPTLLLTLYLLLAIASAVTLKDASSALFLAQFSARQLPYVLVATAAGAGLFVAFYIRWSVRLPQNLLLIYTQMFLASHLVLFWWLSRPDPRWLPPIICVWVGVYAVIIPSQVWTLANHLFTTRQARRLFSVVGSGGLVGAALGGLLSKQLAPRIGTPYLLLVCVGFLLACAAIVGFLWRSAPGLAAPSSKSKQAAPSNLAQSLDAIRGSPYLVLMTLLVLLSTLLNNLVDYQFKFIVKDTFGTRRDEMTAFLGGFTSYLALFSFLMQLVLTSRVMRWFGLNFAIFVLPLSMLTGSSVLLFSTTLLAASLLKGFDRAFRHSIDRSSTELLWVPLPARLKQQAKSFIDMVVSRVGDGLGALLLIPLVSMLHFSLQQISWVSITIIVPWMVVAWLLRREYVNTLRASIERKDISAEALLVEMAGASPEEITTVLSSGDERAMETGLGLLQYGQGNVASAHLGALLTHLSPTIRRKALSIIVTKNVPGCQAQVGRFLYMDDHIDSLWQALDYLEHEDGAKIQPVLMALMESPYPVLRGTAAARLLNMPDSPHRARAQQVLGAFVETAQAQSPEYRRRAAELLGLAPADLACQSVLGKLLSDADVEVVRAAATSAGRTRQRALLPRLVEVVGDRRFRTEARRALASFGPDLLPDLKQVLLDPKVPLRARRYLPRVFVSLGGQLAADYLLLCIDQPDPELRYQALRALTRIRLRQPEVGFSTERITPLVTDELRRYYRHRTILEGLASAADAQPALEFLRRALSETLARQLDIIFRLIALYHPTKEILDAYYGITSGRRDLRSNALEFLDTRLQPQLRQMLLPVVEERARDRLLEQARTLFGIETPGYPAALRVLLAEPNPWLQSCAIYAAAGNGLREIAPLLEPLASTDDALLAETVQLAQRRLPPTIWKT